MSQPNKATPNEAREVLAFSLYALNEPTPFTHAERSAHWRGDAELRSKFRNAADELRCSVQQHGLRIAVSDSKKVRTSIEEITTAPATRAYNLNEELS